MGNNIVSVSLVNMLLFENTKEGANRGGGKHALFLNSLS